MFSIPFLFFLPFITPYFSPSHVFVFMTNKGGEHVFTRESATGSEITMVLLSYADPTVSNRSTDSMLLLFHHGLCNRPFFHQVLPHHQIWDWKVVLVLSNSNSSDLFVPDFGNTNLKLIIKENDTAFLHTCSVYCAFTCSVSGYSSGSLRYQEPMLLHGFFIITIRSFLAPLEQGKWCKTHWNVTPLPVLSPCIPFSPSWGLWIMGGGGWPLWYGWKTSHFNLLTPSHLLTLCCWGRS